MKQIREKDNKDSKKNLRESRNMTFLLYQTDVTDYSQKAKLSV